ncbi:aspartyl/asparaginyl beta-hydroxylase domain-containing protein [Streptomyces sp. NPDC015350]|uniref:aspartyl/asparaginyl beta-hydroxylase domain-containing protein n=1 Tax=Streptomyces sp. NPDC015350 TaxID=3364955 RepID=UPI0036FA9ACA
MTAWVKDSRPHLESWIDRTGADRSQLTRIFEGMDEGESRTPSTETGPQRPEILCPGLEASPWWDKNRFPWIAGLEKAYPDIRGEFLKAWGAAGPDADGIMRHPNSRNLARSGRWSAYYFHLLGQVNQRNMDSCPRTSAVLSGISGADSAGMSYFSVMDPGTHVAPHCGFINVRVRCHLGLVVPEGCAMRVHDETRDWTEGMAFTFDDSFDHEVWNKSEGIRAVLLFDVWHPDLNDTEKAAMTYMMQVWKEFLYRDVK